MAFVVLSLFIFAVEIICKGIAEEREEEGVRRPILKGKLFLTKFHNKGAFRGFLQEKPEIIKGICIGLTALCTLIYFLTLGRKGNRLMKTGLALLLGGAYSNTYDRMKKEYVVDYFGFQIKNNVLGNMIFNISDFCIGIGAMIACIGYELKL